MEQLRCYRCGHSLAALSLPLSRLEECPSCTVHLHVCRMCRNYAPRRPSGCSEDDAPDVRDKTSANFCDYFKPSPSAFDPAPAAADARARADLDALFGGGAREAQQPPSDGGDPAIAIAEALFKRR